MSKLIIDVQHLSKSFESKKVVHDISIKVPEGKIYGFLGPNGSGKTTTLRMLCGLLTPDSGNGTCLGFDVLTQSDLIRQKTGYMTQKFSYWEDLTIRENLEFVGKIFKIDRLKSRVDQSIERLGLKDRQKQLAGSLSGGWKQRLALAASVLHDPKLLLLDEPTAGVDPVARREFWDEIHYLANQGLTVLVTTHYMDEAERCHRIIYITQGRLIVEGTVEEVIGKAHLTTWIVSGSSLMKLQYELMNHPAISNIAPFGSTLHISGRDEALLSQALQPYLNNPEYQWIQALPSMEDAFIHFMTEAQMGRI